MDFDADEIDADITKRTQRPNTVNAKDNEQLFNHLTYLQELNESITDFKQIEEESPGGYNIEGLDE